MTVFIEAAELLVGYFEFRRPVDRNQHSVLQRAKNNSDVSFAVLTQPASKGFDLFPTLEIDHAERYYGRPDWSGSERCQILA